MVTVLSNALYLNTVLLVLCAVPLSWIVIVYQLTLRRYKVNRQLSQSVSAHGSYLVKDGAIVVTVLIAILALKGCTAIDRPTQTK